VLLTKLPPNWGSNGREKGWGWKSVKEDKWDTINVKKAHSRKIQKKWRGNGTVGVQALKLEWGKYRNLKKLNRNTIRG